FSTLAHTPLTFRFDDAHTALRASGPVIETNSVGAVRGIRWNDRSVEPPQVEPDRVDEVYRALRVFAAVLGRTELHLHLKLEPGDCIVFDNTRILHARTAFADGSARRHLQGCYADLDGLASTVSVHERRAIDAIERVFTSAAGLAYLGENVTMIQHQLQAGALALAAGSADALVVASLLHDVGHMVGHHVGELEATAALDEDADAHHDASGARWLAQWFGQDVTEPVRLHVAAKRFLVATEPAYAALLSPASVYTLQLQGGPMSTAEVDAFRTSPYAADAVALRRFDEAAKDPGSEAPSLVAHRELIRRVLNGGHRG
ncbi:MAG TPA: TauD/TfdA family dioxygenase, partial [Ilumatobacteraceae bacterium]